MDHLTQVLLGLTTLLGLIFFGIRRQVPSAAFVKRPTNIPGMKGRRRWPIVGDAVWFWKAKQNRDVHGAIRHLVASRQKLISLYFGPKLVIVVQDANIMEAIMSSNKLSAKDYWFYHSIKSMTNGVFTKNGTGWSDFRRPLDRLLHSKHMEHFHRIFTDKTNTLCTKVGAECNKRVFDIRNMIEFCMLDIVLESLLGTPGTQQIEDTMNNMSDIVKKGLDVSFRRSIKVQYFIDWIYNLSSLGRQGLELKKKIRPTLKQMLDNSRSTLEREGRDPARPDFVPENYIEVAIQVGIKRNRSEEEITFSFLDLVAAGYETTSVVISSAVLFLAMHPEYQEKAYQEQIEVMGGSLDAPSKEELSRMKYLQMVINETLRKASTPAISRYVKEESVIDGYIFPKGACLAVMFEPLINDARYWEKPNAFFPDHFLPEKVAARPKSAFFPFSFGSRTCPGKLFGNQSSKFVLSMLLRRYKFTTDLKYEEMVYRYRLMAESEKGYPVKVTARPNLSQVA